MISRLWSALVIAAVLAVLGVFLFKSGQAAAVTRAGPMALLDVSGLRPAVPDFAVSAADARRAVSDNPMNQRLVNIAMVATARDRGRVRSAGGVDSRWFAALSELGWRDTASRQNLLAQHARREDVPAALDDVDGLLRRNQLIEQISPVLLAMEADPAWRPQVVDRLRRRPSWRFGYLQRGSLIDDPTLLSARARTIRSLQRSGGVQPDEVAPVLPKLLAAGLGADAFEIWRTLEPSIARPVADPSFAELGFERTPSTVPFHWQLTNGPDYSVDVVSRPVPHLLISWNGANAPVFAGQHLSMPAGRYAVVLTTPEPDSDLAEIIGVRAICGDDAVEFARSRRLEPDRVAFTGERTVPCAFPRLELFGRSGGTRAQDRRAAISNVAIAAAI